MRNPVRFSMNPELPDLHAGRRISLLFFAKNQNLDVPCGKFFCKPEYVFLHPADETKILNYLYDLQGILGVYLIALTIKLLEESISMEFITGTSSLFSAQTPGSYFFKFFK